jgi:branched-chain amino acid transport system substrate-binding protein
MRLHSFLRIRFLAACAAVGLVAGLGLAGCQRTPDVLKIGVGQPLSGELADLGQDMLHGATLAVEEINARGGVRIGDKHVKLEVVQADDKADVEAGKQAATALVEADVLVAIAHLNSGVSIATAPIYGEADIPQLAISTKPSYTELGQPTTLRLVANDNLQARAIASYGAQLPGAQRFAVIDDNTPYGKGLADDVARAMTQAGQKVAVRRSLDNKTIQFEPVVKEMAAASVDVTVVAMNDFQVEALITQMATGGLNHMRILGADLIKTDKLLRIPPGQVQAIYATSPIIDPTEFHNGRVFIDTFTKRFKGPPIYGAHYSYDAVYLVADALSRNGSAHKGDLLKQLKRFDGNAPVTGSMRFMENGEQRYGAVGVYEVRNNAWRLVIRSDRW